MKVFAENNLTESSPSQLLPGKSTEIVYTYIGIFDDLYNLTI